MSNQFHDMELRVLNASPCEVNFRGSRATYGVLYIREDESEQWFATFGDLTVPVTDKQAMFLMALARDRSIFRQR